MKVESIAECSPAILLTCINLKTNFWSFLMVAVLHRFYCITNNMDPDRTARLLHAYHTLIQSFCQGWSRPDGLETAWATFFFLFSPQLIFQFTEGVQWFYYRENYTFERIQRGSNIFQGGRGVRMLISIETHITCDFQGVVQTPYPHTGSAHVYCVLLNKLALCPPFITIVFSLFICLHTLVA